ncbi:MAG TPA: RNA polymerase sigma factor [Candidatus Gemmiger stercoravium]|nr:RNA polymerase sigma factor [Candidatus Gemmiger stercoravium]
MRAVEELYATYRDDLFRYLCSLTHDPAQAEDLLSETFLQALQSAGSFRGQSSEKTWLFGIARNLWLRALRRRRPTVPLEDLAGLAAGEEPADAAAARMLRDRIRTLLAQKDERTRAIVMQRMQGVPFETIARALGISAGSARVMDYRTRQWLKETLRKEGLL